MKVLRISVAVGGEKAMGNAGFNEDLPSRGTATHRMLRVAPAQNGFLASRVLSPQIPRLPGPV